jgi:hypothetical protein
MLPPSIPYHAVGACPDASDKTAKWNDMQIEVLWGLPCTGKSHYASQRQRARVGMIAVVEGMEWRKYTPQKWIAWFAVNRDFGMRYAKIIVIDNSNPATWWPDENSASRWTFFSHVKYYRYYGPLDIKVPGLRFPTHFT